MLDINWETKGNKRLIEAFLSLQNKEEMEYFLRDLMTRQEIEEFGKRLMAAEMLSRDVQYNAIIESTGLSSTTIARISKWLKGPLGGYRLVIKNMAHHNPFKFEKGLSCFDPPKL